MTIRNHRWPAHAALLIGISTFAPSVCAATFTPLGALPDKVVSIATAVSADGSVVVGTSNMNAFRWTASTGMVALPEIVGSSGSKAFGISGDGLTILGQANGPGFIAAVRWVGNTGPEILGEPGAWVDQGAYASSYDGSVIGGDRGIWTEITGWTYAGGFVNDITTDGAMAVGGIAPYGCTNPGSDAFFWRAQTGRVGLGDLDGGPLCSWATAVSADGGAIVGTAYSIPAGEQAFIWTESEGMIGLGYAPNHNQSRASDISGDGRIIVGESHNGQTSNAVIWIDRSPAELLLDLLVARGATGLEGWSLKQALAISDDGRTVVGWGYNAAGLSEAFMATIAPIPVPAAIYLFCGSLGLLILVRRRK